MTDRDLEERLRAWYRAEIDDDDTAPISLRTSLAAMAHSPSTSAGLFGSRRSLALLAAAMLTALLIGGAIAAGSGLLRLPSVLPPSPSAATPSAAPDSEGVPRVDRVAVVMVDGLVMRTDPGTDAALVTYLYMEPEGGCRAVTAEVRLTSGQRVFVAGGPISSSGDAWYQVRLLDVQRCQGTVMPGPFGWVAGTGENGEPWLVAAEVPCPSEQPVPVTALVELDREEWLACFGDGALTIRGWGAEPPGTGCGYSPPGIDFWLSCGLPMYQLSVDATAPGFIGGPTAIEVIWDPSDPPTGFAAGVLLDVTGSLDHPLSATCGLVDHETLPPTEPAPPDYVLTCRTRFVVTSVALAPTY